MGRHSFPCGRSCGTGAPRRRRGTILIVAMIIIFAVAALVLTLAQAMRIEAGIAANAAAAREATAVERGAEQYILALLAESADPVETLQESYYEAVPLGTGYFWILRPDYGDAEMAAFGITDESAKLDLNTLDYERLRLLPGMTDELAASIVDWRDEDDEATEGIGAESQVYLSRSPGHNAKNQPYETVEELLLVEGMTREILYGDGTAPPLGQQDGIIDTDRPFENEGYRIRGLFDLFTLWSAEPSTSLEGEPRLDVNATGRPPEEREEVREQVREILREVFGTSRGNELAGRVPSTNVVDIFDFALILQMEPAELAEIEDRITVLNAQIVAVVTEGGGQVQVQISAAGASGKINVNQAAREVLLTLPDLPEADVDALIARRSTAVQDDPHSIAWVLEVLGPRARGLGNLITGRGANYSADILAVSGNGRAFKRVRIVVDTSGENGPQIVYRRDLSEQGWPMDPQMLHSLRTGQGPEQNDGLGRFR